MNKEISEMIIPHRMRDGGCTHMKWNFLTIGKTFLNQPIDGNIKPIDWIRLNQLAK